MDGIADDPLRLSLPFYRHLLFIPTISMDDQKNLARVRNKAHMHRILVSRVPMFGPQFVGLCPFLSLPPSKAGEMRGAQTVKLSRRGVATHAPTALTVITRDNGAQPCTRAIAE